MHLSSFTSVFFLSYFTWEFSWKIIAKLTLDSVVSAMAAQFEIWCTPVPNPPDYRYEFVSQITTLYSFSST